MLHFRASYCIVLYRRPSAIVLGIYSNNISINLFLDTATNVLVREEVHYFQQVRHFDTYFLYIFQVVVA